MSVPEGCRRASPRVSVLGHQPACAAAGEFLSNVEDGVGQTFHQSFLVLFLDGAVPGEQLIVVNGLIELHNRSPLEGKRSYGEARVEMDF